MTKHWTSWTLAATAILMATSVGLACDGHAPAAEAKDASGAAAAPVAAMATPGDAKGCDMPCCAQAKDAAAVKGAAPVKADAPCAAHDTKGCPKKATASNAVAKAEPAKEASVAAPAADPGTRH